MNIQMKGLPEVRLLPLLLFSALLVFTTCSVSSAGYISTTNKYAWSETAGWTNFRPLFGEVTVNSSYLSGYVWQQNLGWLKLGATGSGPYQNSTATNWGVNRDSAGTLSGYAWSEGWGWVNFNPSGGGVSIDSVTGAFSGMAWAENFGWISFQSSSGASVAYGVGLATYTLKLIFNGNGNGTGSVTSVNPPFSCNTGCTKTFLEINPLTLTADASQYSNFGNWAGCDTVTGTGCDLTLDRDRTATVTFTLNPAYKTRIDKSPPAYYSTLQEAYKAALTGNIIQVWGIDLAETLVCKNNTQVRIIGGYDQQYLTRPGMTTMHGLTISQGMVTVDRIVIR